jgi:hypothetical protein
VKSILRGRPSPALVISMIALFVSLSGVSYGVATGFIDSREIKNNEIRSRDIRNNQVRSIDLRNNEVRGIDIRNSTVQGRDIALNTVTGEDIGESTLGKVPSATLADSATSATTASGVSTLKVIPRTTSAEGAAPVTLAQHGPLTLTGSCQTNGPGTNAELSVKSTEDGAAAGGDQAQPEVNASDPALPVATVTDAAAAPPRMVDVRTVFASAPSGKGFTGAVAMYADASGAGVCTFHGHLGLQG